MGQYPIVVHGSISIFSKISFSISRSISILSLKNNQDQYQYQDQYFFQTQYQYQDQYSQKSQFNINTCVNIFNILILILKINILLANIQSCNIFVTFYCAMMIKINSFVKTNVFLSSKSSFNITFSPKGQ